MNDSIPQGASFGVDDVIVRGIGDHINAAITAAKGIAAKADATVSQALAVVVPVRVASPAIIDRVARAAGGEVGEGATGCAVHNGPIDFLPA